MKNIFAIDPHGQKERCGMATLLQNEFLQQSKDTHNIKKIGDISWYRVALVSCAPLGACLSSICCISRGGRTHLTFFYSTASCDQ